MRVAAMGKGGIYPARTNTEHTRAYRAPAEPCDMLHAACGVPLPAYHDSIESQLSRMLAIGRGLLELRQVVHRFSRLAAGRAAVE